MEPAPVSSEWDAPPDPRDNPVLRAALWTWALGALEVAVCGVLVAAFVSFATFGLAWARSTVAADATPEQLATMPQTLWLNAVVTAVLGLAPGIAFLVLGFGVRRGHSVPTGLALLLVITQALVVGVFLLNAVVVSIAAGAPGMLTLAALLFGTPLALLVTTARWLFLARQAGQLADGHAREPWDGQDD